MSSFIVGFFPCLCSIGTMTSKRAGSKDTVGDETRDVVEHVSMVLPIYEDTKIFIDRDIKMKWNDTNDTFLATF